MNKLILKRWSIALATATTLMFFPASAHADPVSGIAALIGAVTTAASGGTLTAVLSGLAAAAFKIGVNMLISKMFEKEEKQVGVKDDLDSGGNLPLSFIMGEFITAGKLIYANCGGNDLNDFLTLVISVSDIPITAFSSEVWINNEKCNVNLSETTIDADSSGDADSPSDKTAPYPGYHPIIEYDKQSEDDYERQYCWMRFYDGTQTVADPYLIRTFGSDPDKPWTSDMVGKGCAYVVVVCRYSGNGVWSGVPTFKFPVQGIKLYDVSKDSTNGGSGSHRWGNKATWEFSRNPKVMIYNLVRGIYYGNEWIWGGQNLAAYQLPSDYWITAIAHCNENITKADSTVIKRYTAGVEVDVDKQPLDLIKELDKTCAGYTTEYGGQWKTFAGPPAASIFSITDDDIIITEEQTDDLYRPLENTFNGATGTFTSPNKGWVSRDLKPYNVQAYKDADNGFELIASLTLPLVTEVNQAKRLMVMAVKDSRQQRSHIIQLPPSAYTGEPFSVINWNSTRNGYVNKKFAIQAQDDLPNCNQLVVIRETNPSDYDYDVSLDEADPVGAFKPIKPGQLALDFTVTPDQIDRPGGGKDKPAINIAWTWGFKDSGLKWVKYEVRRSATQTKVIAQGTFHNTEDTSRTISSTAFRFKQSFQVRLYAQPERTWQKSSWTAWKTVTLIDIDVPGAPTLTRISDLADNGDLNFFIDIDWTAVSSDVTYTIRFVTGSRTFYRRSDENAYRLPVTSGKSYTISVRAVASDGGTKGDWSSATSITVTKKNTAPTAPTSLSVVGDNHRAFVTGNKSPDADWKRMNVYMTSGNVNDFSTASQVGSAASTNWTKDNLGNNVTRYFWITFEDSSGNESSKFPASNTAGIGATTLRVVDDDTDQTPPGTPTATTLNQYTADVDGDSTIDTGLSMTLLSPAGVPVKWLEVQIWRSSTLGGTYTALPKRHMVKAESSGTTDFAFEGSSSKFYKARYRGISFSGIEGPFSLLSAAQQPLQYLSSIPTPTLTVTPKPKGMALKCSKWQNNTYLETIFYRDGVEIFRIKGNAKTDNEELTVNTGYTYTCQHMDKQERVGALSAGVTATYRAAVTADITPKAVTASLTDFGDTSNMVIGSDLAEPALWIGTGGVPTQALPNIVSASKFRLVSATSSTSTTRIQSAPDYRIPVEADTQYTMSASIGSNIGVSANYSLRINWYSRDASGNAVSILQSIVASFVGTAITYLVGTVASPPNASWAEFLVLKSASAVASPIELNEPVFRRTIDGDLLADGTVNKDKTTIATPSTPGAGTLTVAQDPRNVQADGVVQMTAKLTASALPAGAETVTFDVDYSYPAATDIKSFDAGKGLSVTIPITYNQTIGVTYKGVGFNENAGPPIASAVTLTPVRKIGAPADPTGVVFLGPNSLIPLGIGAFWNAPTDLDYAYSEIAALTTVGTPAITDVVQTTTRNNIIFFYPGQTPKYFYVRHVNQSGIPSNWVQPGYLSVSSLVSTTYVNASFFNDGLSAMAIGAVGTTMTLKKTTAGNSSPGSTAPHTSLVYSDSSNSTGANPPSGTYMCMGFCTSGNSCSWLRIS